MAEQVLLYNAAEPPLGAGVASGKSALIRQAGGSVEFYGLHTVDDINPA